MFKDVTRNAKWISMPSGWPPRQHWFQLATSSTLKWSLRFVTLYIYISYVYYILVFFLAQLTCSFSFSQIRMDSRGSSCSLLCVHFLRASSINREWVIYLCFNLQLQYLHTLFIFIPRVFWNCLKPRNTPVYPVNTGLFSTFSGFEQISLYFATWVVLYIHKKEHNTFIMHIVLFRINHMKF